MKWLRCKKKKKMKDAIRRLYPKGGYAIADLPEGLRRRFQRHLEKLFFTGKARIWG
jgi:hypothetical protein